MKAKINTLIRCFFTKAAESLLKMTLANEQLNLIWSKRPPEICKINSCTFPCQDAWILKSRSMHDKYIAKDACSNCSCVFKITLRLRETLNLDSLVSLFQYIVDTNSLSQFLFTYMYDVTGCVMSTML